MQSRPKSNMRESCLPCEVVKVFESCAQSLNPNLDSLVTVCFVKLLNTSTFQNYTTIYTRARAHTHLLCMSIVFIRDVSTGESREKLVLGEKRGKINTSTHIKREKARKQQEILNRICETNLYSKRYSFVRSFVRERERERESKT